MDTTMNYQALAMDIVMAAIEDAQSGGDEAPEAQEWLEHVDLSTLGIEGLALEDLEVCASMNSINDTQ